MRTSPVTGLPVVQNVFGEPRNRYVQCPGCCEQVMLGGGAFRGHLLEHSACGVKFHISWEAKIRVRT